jgi:hypothetical protein
MPRRKREPVRIMNAVGSATDSSVINVEDYRHVVVVLSATLNSTLTFNFKGSVLDTADLTAARTIVNLWDYVSAYDLEDPATLIDGDTGVTLNNATVVANTHQYIINTDHLALFAVETTAWTDGAITVWAVAVND